MPDTRNSSMAESLASLSASFADLAARTQTVESTIATEAAESACTTSTFERVLGMLDQLSSTVKDLQLAARHAEKQPMQAPALPPTSSLNLAQTVFGTYGSPQRSSTSTNPPLAIEGTSTGHQRLPRIDIPTFTGEDVDGWLFQLNRFFTNYVVPHDQKLMIATFHTSGEALKWVQWLHATQQQLDWDSFEERVAARFGPPAYYSAKAMINKLFQTGTVATFIDEFETLSTRTPGLSSDNLRHRFIAGLKEEIHSEIVMFNPTTLHQAMGLARLAEQKIHSFRPRTFAPRLIPQPLALLPAPPVAQPAPTGLSIKRLTPVEMAARREKGLCFNCDDKYTPGHKCRPRFQSLVMEDEPLIEDLDLSANDPPALHHETPTMEGLFMTMQR
ncbi:unnamed protein product [Rhodiola kirilowii]